MSVVFSVYIAVCLHFTKVTAAACFHSGCYNLCLQWLLQHVYIVTVVAYYVHIDCCSLRIRWLLQSVFIRTAAGPFHKSLTGAIFVSVCLIVFDIQFFLSTMFTVPIVYSLLSLPLTVCSLCVQRNNIKTILTTILNFTFNNKPLTFVNHSMTVSTQSCHLSTKREDKQRKFYPALNNANLEVHILGR